MTRSPTLSRRALLRVTAIAGTGFMIGCEDPSVVDDNTNSASDTNTNIDTAPLTFNHFINISTDDTVTVVVKHLDKGQGVTTGLPAIVAEELGARWDQMRWQYSPADSTRYNNLFWGPVQGTGGSSSIANSWKQLRTAGAAAREMIINAAAKEWGVPATEITVSNGKAQHSSGKTASIGELAIAASQITPPTEPKLKLARDFKLIGVNASGKLPRMDSKEKSTGTAQYTIDVKRPNMLSAVMAHPPLFGATVKHVDDTKALQIEGVEHVLTTPRGVAVVAKHHWAALKGREALTIEWDDSAAEKRSSDELTAYLQKVVSEPMTAVREEGDIKKAFNESSKTIEMTFDFPYLAHATMEPMNCVLQLKNGECHIWTGSQVPTLDVGTVAAITGIPPENVHLHVQFAGGSFGRRAVPDSDYVAETAMIAKALGKTNPIKLQWTREDDMLGGRYRPMAHHQFQASLDNKGNLTGWHQRATAQSILRGTPFEAMISGAVDDSLTEGGKQLPYSVPNITVEAAEAEIGVPVLWWRSVGHTFNAYSTEVFLDEIAHASQQDPVELRKKLLTKHPKHKKVLELAADKSNWGSALPSNTARGIALHESFNTVVAQVAEVTLNGDGSYRVNKITCAVDCGIAVTPDVVKAQLEGGIGYGLSATMGEAITLKEGRVEQNNFHTYQPLRINQMPEIDVHIVESNEAPTGVGEPGTPPAGPAVANALRALTGKAITQLPIGPSVTT
ncbi:xanthine dehydrogenase family protein molybdopterin-binding subunit [Marinibactrum halimedae]|uniref:Oxidoreductase n=1 Tax=Marinibactrum halimedae TaxID=1444977 RepID=A0AA37T0X6_9GAMM|nr:xanthine dehydrogenase family protein molybdopterin-binding subunit [Marinibactrum halimedae]MCD9457742.1 xanthine dehydrogenase family protein molybdopterin-binding subunit [Marinibactrum halimedae]GLS24884.1 oxidoreductase [Marinibactrum halimedae]